MPNKLNDFITTDQTGVFTAPRADPQAFTYSDSDEAENEILGILETAEDKSSGSLELEHKIHNWPTRYHLSGLRSNIIRSLDFLKPEAKILEIGSGCGAVTRFLGENFASVDAVEGSFRRARITRKRCQDLDNIRVFSSPLQDLIFDREYDVVMLIGVLEWAPMFYPGDPHTAKPVPAMLQHAASALKENGILLLAIENKLGLKYMSGCREDHSGSLFDSLHGYPRDNTPVTFSKIELSELLEDVSLNHREFYYPFPDYKLATTILREVPDPGSYFLHNWLTEPFEDYFGEREYFFHEGLVIRSTVKAKMLYNLANSFVVAATADPTALATAKNQDWIARRFSSAGRIPEFRTVTTLSQTKDSDSPVIHKQRLLDSPGPEGPIKFTPSQSSWQPGNLLQFSLFEALFQENALESIVAVFRKYHDELLSQFATREADAEGYPLVNPEAMDFVPFNIICQDDKLLSIDLEWCSAKPITADYVVFRGLFGFVRQQAPFIFQNLPVPNNDMDALLITIMRRFYSQYDAARHLINRSLEEEFQSIVAGCPVKLPSGADFLQAKDRPEKKELDRLRSSWSWKITAPLRWFRRLIIKKNR